MKQRQPNLFSEAELDAMVASRDGRPMVKTTDRNGNTFYRPDNRKTKEDFVAKANEVWHGIYDYSESDYQGGKKPITIYCPKHDYHFTLTMAQNHIIKPGNKAKATGCPYCNRENAGPHNHRYPPEEEERRRKEKEEMERTRREVAARNIARREAERKRLQEERKAQRRAANEERLRLQKEETLRRREEKKRARALEVQQRQQQREQQRIKELQERILREGPLKQGEGYQYREVEKVTTLKDTVLVHCPNPAHEWHPMLVRLILEGCKCRECAGRHQPVGQRRDAFLAKFYKKHGHNHYQLTADDYVNNDTPIKVHCLVHHYDFETAPDNLLRGGGGCPYCTASEGEATILGWLGNHGINHVWHHQLPNDDRSLPLLYIEADFYLPDHRLIIEYHGEQHYKNIPHFYKGKKLRNFAVQRQRDQYLRDYCERVGLSLLEIPYWDMSNIPMILEERLLE